MVDDRDTASTWWTNLDTLVNGDPKRVQGLLDEGAEPQARLAAAVYRASAHLHQDASPQQRRHLLALDAARYGDRELAGRIGDVAVAGAPAPWRVEWAVGASLDARLRHPMEGDRRSMWSAATTVVDGRPVAVTGSHFGVLVWDLSTGRQIGEELEGHEERVFAVGTAVLDGRPVAVTGGEDDTIRVWDLLTLEQLGEAIALDDSGDEVMSLATTVLDGQPVIVSGGAGTLRLWDLATHAPMGDPLTGHAGGVSAMTATTLDGRPVVVSAGADGTVRLWDLTAREQIGPAWEGHDGLISGIATAVVDGRAIVVTGAEDATLRRWDLATGDPVGAPMIGHAEAIREVDTAVVDGRIIAVSGSIDHTVRFWDLATGEQAGVPITAHDAPVWAVATAEVDGRPVLVTGDANEDLVRVWDLGMAVVAESAALGEAPAGHTDDVWTLATSEVAGRQVAVSGSSDRTVQVWDLDAGAPVGDPLTGHTWAVTSLVTTTLDDRPVAISGGGRIIRTWDLATRTPVGDPQPAEDGHTILGTAIVNGRRIVLAAGDKLSRPGSSVAFYRIRMWDLATGEPVGRQLAGHPQRPMGGATVDVDGRPIAITICDDRSAKLWDLEAGEPYGPRRLHIEESARFGHIAAATLNDRPVVATTDHGTLRTWDVTTGKQLGPNMTGHDWHIETVALGTLAGRPVAVTGGGLGEAAVCVWDLDAGEQLGPALLFPTHIRAVAVTSDARVVVGYGTEIAVLRWTGTWAA